MWWRGARHYRLDEVPLAGVSCEQGKAPDRGAARRSDVTANDVEVETSRIGVELEPLTIVLVNTSAGKRYGSEDCAVNAGAGMGYEATMYLFRAWCSRFTVQTYGKLGCPL